METTKEFASADPELAVLVYEAKAAYRSALASGRLRAAISMASNLWTLTEDRFWLKRAAELEGDL